jgi:hypothetical protein
MVLVVGMSLSFPVAWMRRASPRTTDNSTGFPDAAPVDRGVGTGWTVSPLDYESNAEAEAAKLIWFAVREVAEQ